MRKIKLIIDLLPTSLNTIKAWLYDDRTKYKYPALVEEWETAIQESLIDPFGIVRIRPLIKKASITIKYYFKVKRARDLDNYSGFKPLLDSLKGQVIEDDRDDWVKVDWEILVDRDNPRTVIEIEEKR